MTGSPCVNQTWQGAIPLESELLLLLPVVCDLAIPQYLSVPGTWQGAHGAEAG